MGITGFAHQQEKDGQQENCSQEPAIDDEVEMIDGMGCFRDGTQVSGDKRITAEKEFDVVSGA